MKYQVLKDKVLVLFFTHGVSLRLWHKVGMIDREVAIYNELSKYFKHIYFFTYGLEDHKFEDYLASNISVIPKRFAICDILYSLMLPFIQSKTLKKADLLKTNQMLGSWSAAIAKIIYRKKLVVRTGYVWSIHLGEENAGSLKTILSKKWEKCIYRLADAAITSSQRNFDYTEQNYTPHNHTLIPNYVEIGVFKPLDIVKKRCSICFVGRLTQQKNLFVLLEALVGLPYTLTIVGSGEQRNGLEKYADENKIRVDFLGNVPNHELPKILNQHELFILPSLYEGMPKVLLEAMACGLAVVGTNIDGIREAIKHGENGILCETSPKSIREAILNVMEDEEIRGKLGLNARSTIEKSFSLETFTEKELNIYVRLLSKE
jgi:glycosyltransferase involved in cell wall biosynthesis